MGETNLFEETVYAMTAHDKKWDDIAWVGGDEFYIDPCLFMEVAKETNYDSGWGAQEVADDLIVCFNDGSWLSRAEYDGSEWWRYNDCPRKPQKEFEGDNLKLAGGMWESLYNINYPREWD